jgi:hypothetical protein
LENAIQKPPEPKPQLVESAVKRGRKSRQPTEETIRYFLPKEGSSPAKPELGEEAQNEKDALIKAFQSKGGVMYVVTAFRAEADLKGSNPILVKRPLQK